MAAPLPLSGSYTDPAEQFQIGILEGYRISTIADAPLMESQDGRLAYTVVTLTQPGGPNSPAPITSEAAITQIAQDLFQRGEGFNITTSRLLPPNTLELSWDGRLTIGGRGQPVQGVVLAQSTPQAIFFILVTATDSGADQLPGAIAALLTSFQPL